MNLQNEKLDVSANSIEPKGKYTKKKSAKKLSQKGQKQPCTYSVFCEIKAQIKERKTAQYGK